LWSVVLPYSSTIPTPSDDQSGSRSCQAALGANDERPAIHVAIHPLDPRSTAPLKEHPSPAAEAGRKEIMLMIRLLD
jgi:hypothetical protein